MPVMGATRFQRFFRQAAGLQVDKDDLKRYGDFVENKLYDLLIMGEAAAKENHRDFILPHDLPITRGLQDSVHKFRKLDEAIELAPILDRLATYPPLDRSLAEDTEARLPELVGGLSYALAQAFTIVEPERRNPQTAQWERIQRLFDLLL